MGKATPSTRRCASLAKSKVPFTQEQKRLVETYKGVEEFDRFKANVRSGSPKSRLSDEISGRFGAPRPKKNLDFTGRTKLKSYLQFSVSTGMHESKEASARIWTSFSFVRHVGVNNSSSTSLFYVIDWVRVDEQDFSLRQFTIEPQVTHQVSERLQYGFFPLLVRFQVLEQIDNR